MTDDALVTIEVDGREIKAKRGAMLIEATDAAGIAIPRFCYHPKLSVAANCRMCLVEVERAPKPLPACATPVTEGMKVYTRSPLALAAQKGTMEFLLINHPLDCPICDQGGECELQDVAMGYGADVSRFGERKRVVPNPDIGPLVATDMTRCIHCTRCVRFGEEIAGVRDLGATGRGEHTRIGTYVARSMESELSGNVIDLCPVGALTSKPFRYVARAWELTEREGVSPHDCLGANLSLHVRRNRVVRVHPRPNEMANEVWLSDRDRFSYEGLYAEDRLLQPMIKEGGSWREADWPEALQAAGQRLRQTSGGLATLVSPRQTLEEMYLAQKLTRALGSADIESRLRLGDFRADDGEAGIPTLGIQLGDLEQTDFAWVVGANLRTEQPLLNHRLRKAALRGARVSFLNPLGVDPNFEVEEQRVVAPSRMAEELASVAKVVGGTAIGAAGALLANAIPEERHEVLGRGLADSERGTIIFGALAQTHPDYAVLRDLAVVLCASTNCRLVVVPAGANTVGAYLAGAVRHRGPGAAALETCGAAIPELTAEPRETILLVGLEPALDCGNPFAMMSALRAAKNVVAVTAFRSADLEEVANVLLPLAEFAETSGTYVNATGLWQSFGASVAAPDHAKPGWKILRVLGNELGLEGFDYDVSTQVRDELSALCSAVPVAPEYKVCEAADLLCPNGELVRVADVPIYAGDPLVRRARSLQKTGYAVQMRAVVSPGTASERNLQAGQAVIVSQNGGEARAPLIVDARVPEGCVYIPSGVFGSETLGEQYGVAEMQKG